MTEARTAILDRIRSAAGGEGNPADAYASIPRGYLRTGGLDAEQRRRHLQERLRDYDAQVVETNTAGTAESIAGILRRHGQKQVIVAEGFPAEMLPPDLAFTLESKAGVRELDDCDGVITTCTVAIAFTGTIVLTHGRGEGARRLTLVPDRHLCVVRAEQIVETVPEAADRLAPLATHPMTWISGPSATADIEMTRIRGVHGPRFLNVVLVR